MQNFKKIWYCGVALSILFLVCTTNSLAQFYNGTQNDFGKNRLQYEPREWRFMKFEKFDVFLYKNGNELASYVSQAAINNIKDLETILDFQMEDRFQIVVYNKLSDFRTSNIGLSSDGQFNIGGAARITGSKLIVYYEGDHTELEKQIRCGIAEIMINQILYGGSWKDVLRSSALLTIPEWYLKGLTRFLGGYWDTRHEAIFHDEVLSKKFRNISHLNGEKASRAGTAMWNYIYSGYGISVIPNILYMTRVSRNIESGFIFVLGASLKTMNQEMINFYRQRYQMDESKFPSPSADFKLGRPAKKTKISQFKVSPDGKFAAFSSQQLGKIKIYLVDLETGRKKVIFVKYPKLERIEDNSYPLLAWHPSSKLLSFVTEQKTEVNFTMYNIESKKIEKRPPLFIFEKILDFAYSDDGKKIVCSAVQKGQTDIFVYTLASNYSEQITKDIYDDLYPRFINKSNQIIFSSNRKDDTLRFSNRSLLYEKMNPKRDLFLYDYRSKSKLLRRVTSTPEVDETHPFPTKKQNHFCYLSEQNGKIIRYMARFDSTLAWIDTTEHYRYYSTIRKVNEYNRSILEQDITQGSNNAVQLHLLKNRYTISKTLLPEFESLTQSNSDSKEKSGLPNFTEEKTSRQAPKKNDRLISIETVPQISIPKPDYPGAINAADYKFSYERLSLSKKTEKDKKETSKPDTLTLKKVSSNNSGTEIKGQTEISAEPNYYVIPKLRPYAQFFLTDQFVTQFDNNFLNANYQKFTGGEIYYNPGLTGLMKIGLSDVLEDRRIVGGFRLGESLRANEFFISHENRERRWDRQWFLYRQSFPFSRGTEGAPRQVSHLLRYSLKYPFNEVLSLRLGLSGRLDKNTYLSNDINNLRRPDEFIYWSIGKSELIFDNTRNPALNIFFGTRVKLFYEFFQKLNDFNTRLSVIGVDFRNYVPIYRNIIWAGRIAASTSMGTEKLIYYLGSVDNWLNLNASPPTFNRNMAVDRSQNYAFQALASNLRGFNQNIRNGNSFALINSEIRIPLFATLAKKPIKSDFIGNFQLIAFGDIGTAWTGKTPYSSDNSFNTQVITSGPITVSLKRKQEPIVGGYGWGMRSKLFGYFIRLDWAWGVDSGIIQPRITYLSISTDF